jgi:hypothetical protein
MDERESNGKYKQIKEEFERIQKRYSGMFGLRKMFGLNDGDRKSLEKCVKDLESLKNRYSLSERSREELRSNPNYIGIEYLQDVINVYMTRFRG